MKAGTFRLFWEYTNNMPIMKQDNETKPGRAAAQASGSSGSAPLGWTGDRLTWFGKAAAILFLAVTAAQGGETNTTTAAADAFTSMDLDQLMQVKVPIVYGASKHEQKITEAPSAVSIVTQEDIKEFGYRTLGDILRGVRDLYVTSDRAYQTVGIRGVNRLGDFGGRVLLTLDGHRLNEPVYDSTFFGQDFPLDVDLIERVEVIRGPGSALYGNNAFFGIVNVITRKGRDLQGAEVSGLAGDQDTYGGRFSFGKQFKNGVEVLASGTYFDTRGQDKLAYDPALVPAGRHPDWERSSKFYGSVSYGDFTLWGLFGQREKALAPGTWGMVVDNTQSRITDTRSLVELKFQKDFGSDWSVLARAYYDYYGYQGNYEYDYMDPFNPGITINRDDNHAKFGGGEIQLNKILCGRHRLTFGLEGRDDFDVSQRNFDVNPPTTYIDTTSTEGNFGLYGQAEVAVLTNLTLNAGVRYDYFTTFGSTVNPRGGLIYHPWSLTTLKALYGQAYRAPNAYEFDFQNINYAANHALRPETIRSYELVLEQAVGQHMRLTGSFFYNDIEDLITQGIDPSDGRFIFRNTDAVQVKGGSVELETVWKYGLRTRASYTFAEAKDTSTGALLNNAPKHLGKLQIVAPLYRDKVSLGFELQAVSDRITARGNKLEGQVIGNLTLFSHDLVKNLELSASIYNLWDTKYSDPVSSDFVTDTVPQDRRNFRVKLTYRF
ncbi:MAG: TonB-dependent receptor [Pedosphaera sp.]|nr:TonB-dependent receptor [Pedosphaera sp.]